MSNRNTDSTEIKVELHPHAVGDTMRGAHREASMRIVPP